MVTQNADSEGHPVVEARCRRGHGRVIHPGEIEPLDVPVCRECGGVMFAHSARSCECSWVSPNDGSGAVS